jgi:hypothetical protein
MSHICGYEGCPFTASQVGRGFYCTIHNDDVRAKIPTIWVPKCLKPDCPFASSGIIGYESYCEIHAKDQNAQLPEVFVRQ